MPRANKNNWAYLAGFLDADGSIYVRVKPNNSYRYGFQISPSVVFFQSRKQREEIKRMQEFYDIGYLRDRSDGIVEWIIGDKKSIEKVLIETSPFLRFKIKQAHLMLDVLGKKSKVKTEKQFVSLVRKIDEFKNLNYSKKRSNDAEKVIARLKMNWKIDIKIKEKL